MHEQSETIQAPNGMWVNVYGRGTPKAGQRLPGTGEYATVGEAEAAAGARSSSYGKAKPLSRGERQIKAHVEYAEEMPPETPEEEQARLLRNEYEWKRAHADAARRGDVKAVKILEDERAQRAGIDFSGGFQAIDFRPSNSNIDFQPRAQASQADVRAAEPQPGALEGQTEKERQFEVIMKRWMQATGGKLKPGQNTRQAAAEWSGVPDPEPLRPEAEIEHARETGDVPYGGSVVYDASKALAATGGFALGGPAGATAGEAAVRATALAYNLQRAVEAGAITEERAAEIMSKEMMKGAVIDAGFNFGLPLLGQLITKIPGAKWLGSKVKPILDAAARKAGIGSSTPKPSLREAKIESRVNETTDPVRQEAVRELSKRSGDYIPTPGQVSGEVGATENVINKAFQAPFKTQEKALVGAADDMLRETTTPAGQMEAKQLGETIANMADATQRAVKQRPRPAFQAADDLGVVVDMSPVRIAVSKALLEDAKVAGGKLKPAERADLEAVFEHLRVNPSMSPEAVLDFISRRKEIARAHTADGKPSEYFAGIMTKLAGTADAAYSTAARATGQSKVAADLLRARKQYGGMMETIYEDAMKAALKKNPEDVGRLFWQGGNVSEIEQLHRMLRMAEREGVTGTAGAQKVKQDMARGFLQEAVRDVDSAAKWMDELKKNPLKRDTWNALTQGPDGQALRHAMDVLSHAAQIATVRDTARNPTLIPFGRAASGGLGVSWVTGAIHPGMAVAGLSVAGMMKMMSTAYTHGDKGAINLMAKVLRTNSAGTGAAAKALQSMLPELEALAEKYGTPEVFVPADQPQEQ